MKEFSRLVQGHVEYLFYVFPAVAEFQGLPGKFFPSAPGTRKHYVREKLHFYGFSSLAPALFASSPGDIYGKIPGPYTSSPGIFRSGQEFSYRIKYLQVGSRAGPGVPAYRFLVYHPDP